MISPNGWPNCSSALSATSRAISSTSRPLVAMPMWPATAVSFCSSLILKPPASPLATRRSVMAMSRPWSEWAATPPATWRAKWRAEMVGRSAPQMPVLLSASLPTRRHGPMLQMRQQAPFSPIGQGFMTSARLKAVSIPHSSACASISSAAGSMLFAATGLASPSFKSFMISTPCGARGARRSPKVSRDRRRGTGPAALVTVRKRRRGGTFSTCGGPPTSTGRLGRWS